MRRPRYLSRDNANANLALASTNSRHIHHWAIDLDARLATHTAGNGARLLEVVSARGIGWQIACLERGTRDRERQLKARGAARRCPICRHERRRRESSTSWSSATVRTGTGA